MNSKDHNGSSSDQRAFHAWRHDLKLGGYAALAVVLVVGLSSVTVRYFGAGETRQLVEAMIPTTRFLCASVLTATATILALMLTLISIGKQSNTDLDKVFYLRIRRIALHSTILVGAVTAFLLMHCIPITESDSIAEWWYHAVYYSLLVISSLLGGWLVAIVVSLYNCMSGLISRTCGLDETSGSERSRSSESTVGQSGEIKFSEK